MGKVIVDDFSAREESTAKCQFGVCKWYAYDMDGDFCTHGKSYESVPVYGLSTNAMSREGLCVGSSSSDNVKRYTRELFEPIVNIPVVLVD